MDYYAETNYYDHDQLMISVGKGRDDYFEMFRSCGIRRIGISMFKHGGRIDPLQRIRVEAGLAREWSRALGGLGEGDSLFVATPPSEKFTGLASVIRRVKERGCRIVIVVFDLERFMEPYYSGWKALKYAMSLRAERRLFGLADVMMVHNESMKNYIADMGVDPDIIVPVGIMDYLREQEPDAEDILRRTGRDKPVVFCGNLTPGKAGFLRNVPEGLRIDAYGPGFEYEETGGISYRGVLPPLRLMDEMNASFGLVWDGDSAETAAGACGEYLRYNNPHKMALYLASGIPVIVWEGSAMAGLVRTENCGFAVASLADVRGRIEAMTDAEYDEMVDNAIKVGAGMRRGDHIRAAVIEALEMAREI